MRNIKEFLGNKHLQKKIWFTLGVLFVYLIGTSITVPGTNTELMKGMFDGASVFGLLNMMSGGALERMSVFALGVSPYITASIIVQLLSMDVIPALSEMKEDGEKGQAKMDKITRYLGLALCFMQAYSLTYGFDKNYGVLINPSISGYLFTALVLSAGTMFLIWLGDQIDDYGVGNGLSLLIFAGIANGIPSQFMKTWAMTAGTAEGAAVANGVFMFILYCIVYLAIIVFVVAMEMAVRRIPVQYAGHAAGMNMSYIPMKINSASVIPVIFAQSVITVPQMIVSFFNAEVYHKMESFLSLSSWTGLLLYAVLIVAFEFFYTDLMLDPEKMASDLKKANGYIPGVRAGKTTEKYIRKIMNRITVFGTIFLLILAVIPYLLPMITPIPSTISLGGTGLIILVGVAMETIKEIETLSHRKSYDRAWLTD